MSMNSPNESTVRQTSSDSKTAPAKTVQHVVEMRMFAAEVGDENGMKQQVVAFRVGDQWYHDPLGKQWLDRLRPIDSKQWLAKALESRFKEANAPTAVPTKDTVNIMGGE